MKKKKLWLRILAAVSAFGLLFIAAWITLSFTGDPISAALSQRAAKDYIQQSGLYTMGFEVSRAAYNFKLGGYLVHAVSPNNADLHLISYAATERWITIPTSLTCWKTATSFPVSRGI